MSKIVISDLQSDDLILELSELELNDVNGGGVGQVIFAIAAFLLL
jgi:hypothetical protein